MNYLSSVGHRPTEAPLRLISTDHRPVCEATEKEAPNFAFIIAHSNRLARACPHEQRTRAVRHGAQTGEEHASDQRTTAVRPAQPESCCAETLCASRFISQGRAQQIPREPLRIAVEGPIRTRDCSPDAVTSRRASVRGTSCRHRPGRTRGAADLDRGLDRDQDGSVARSSKRMKGYRRTG